MLAGLTPIVLKDKYIGNNQRKIMMIIIASVGLLLVQNCGDYVTQINDMPTPMYRTVFTMLGYCLRPFILLLFCLLVQPYKKHFFVVILVVCNTLIYLTSLFSGITFFIDKNNHFMRGPLCFTALYVSIFLLAFLFYCTIYEYRHRKASIWVAIANAALIILGASADLSPLYVDYPVAYLSISVVCCTVFYYIWLHLEFVREHENALKAEQRIKIMMSQIQPHFLYNTLTTIQSLCLTNPQKAFETTGKFGAYLRNNIDSLNQSDLIPVEKELEHTKVYADIEMLRFTKISVEYNVEADEFYLPALTIQPLVENAIRHGVRNREHGVVRVETKESGDNYVITVSDNGIGFDTKMPLSTNGTHIGISNVRERIEEICRGTLTINSRPGEGCVVTIIIPERE
ncbi:MAG: histidine kinase [Eubacterium sp.]|nr:histidine kinase [Eubacterium sp.]